MGEECGFEGFEVGDVGVYCVFGFEESLLVQGAEECAGFGDFVCGGRGVIVPVFLLGDGGGVSMLVDGG